MIFTSIAFVSLWLCGPPDEHEIVQLASANHRSVDHEAAIRSSVDQKHEDQKPEDREAEIKRGARIAKAGFQNESDVCEKFRNWKKDADARAWLIAMNCLPSEVVQLEVSKPHGEKSDVEVRVRTAGEERVHGVSVKLVSRSQGFNQIDKRWLSVYAKKWNMPADVSAALELFTGEVPPVRPGRDTRRMFLNELDGPAQKAVIDFFTKHREKIAVDLFCGDGPHAAQWILVTQTQSKSGNSDHSDERQGSSSPNDYGPRWILRSASDAAKFFSAGDVRITSAGSLRIGRITMQRKGGDNGRDSAKMLQFKINPAELFEQPSTPTLEQ